MILVFVGAGGSAAVDPEQYPTTAEFFNRLPNTITQDPLFGNVCRFLRDRKSELQQSDVIDIEEVLWVLGDLRDDLSVFLDRKKITGWMMEPTRFLGLNGLTISTSDFNKVQGGKGHYMSQSTKLIEDINTLVHDFYKLPPAEESQLADWVNLLSQLRNHDPVIEIFTTNYDVVLETVIRNPAIEIETGRKFDGLQTILNTTLWNSHSGSPVGHGRLTKLHGSVDWQRSGNNIVTSEVFTGDLQKHMILYPGYKGEPAQPPFKEFHDHLRAVVRQAKMAIFIGYAFRDEYINRILSELSANVMPPGIMKIIINKDKLDDDLPFAAPYQYLETEFNEKAIKDCIKIVRNP